MEETNMRGRLPSGPEYVQHLQGSEQAKERLQVVLETMAGNRRIGEACQWLGISEQRFYQLRLELLQAALQRLEPKSAGRPRQEATATVAEVAALRQQVDELEMELAAARLREELALAGLGGCRPPAEPEKKTTPRQRRRARSGWWKK
jgi:mRNA-degrading endonuclease toxin of MazEF toxin-antitoxin module